MSLAALVFRIVLSAIFAFAGIAKLSDIERSRKAVLDFGMPAWSAKPLGLLLPFAELLVAILLIPVATVPWGGVAAILLLAVFILGIAINLSLGRKPVCNCFGQVNSEPIGSSTLIRNAVLFAAATFVLWQDRRSSSISIVHSLAGLSPAALGLVAVSVLALVVGSAAAWLTFHLLRQNGRLLLRMDALEDRLRGRETAPGSAQSRVGLPIGSPAPYFELPSQEDGATVTLHTLRAAKKTVALIFSDPGCGPCSELLPHIAAWERDHTDHLTIALISRGKAEAHKQEPAAHALRYVLLQNDREVAVRYQANGTPAALLISPDGTLASELAIGVPAILALISTGSLRLAAPQPVASDHVIESAFDGDARQQSKDLPFGAPAPIV